ncbi:uncharacterized protein LOC142982927 [Anticarsia gemmatalis]|uniref:uncharacterized protein LOC142982927 n=1 Tax=Anticarsia gemmatalis TaxID=129554 RepID=UPI003F77820F
MNSNIYSIYFILLVTITTVITLNNNKTLSELCPIYKKGPNVNVFDLVGSWLTVYTTPNAAACFKFRIRATTELEREQNIVKYGNFSNRVIWSRCLLQVETPVGKHFLQGIGSDSGLMENIFIFEDKPGEYTIQNESADQWIVFGRRGSEVLVIRDCYGESAAAFARAPYWPTVTELSAIFHRSGIIAPTYGRPLCEPKEEPVREFYVTANFNKSETMRTFKN